MTMFKLIPKSVKRFSDGMCVNTNSKGAYRSIMDEHVLPCCSHSSDRLFHEFKDRVFAKIVPIYGGSRVGSAGGSPRDRFAKWEPETIKEGALWPRLISPALHPVTVVLPAILKKFVVSQCFSRRKNTCWLSVIMNILMRKQLISW